MSRPEDLLGPVEAERPEPVPPAAAAALDAAGAAATPAPNGPARAPELPDEPGGPLLDALAAFIRRYVSMTAHQVVAVVLWLAHAHAIDAAEATPYLAVTSPEKRSGKSRLIEVCTLLVPGRWRVRT